MDEHKGAPGGPDQPRPGRPAATPGEMVSAPPTEQRKRVRRPVLRRVLIGAGALVLLMLVVTAVLWHRCGVAGCPDVDMLRGYMPDQASVVVDREGAEIAKLFVTRRVVVPVDSMPEHLLNAFVAIEDRRFWDHGGVDWRRVIGALASNVKAGGIEEGSSTITMQLARNVFPEQLPANQRTITRKLGEARVAREIEDRYSKREIMELYLNQIYFGEGAYGIEAAAEEYFDKGASQLSLAESAILAALPRAPSRLNPRADKEAALEGRALVLRRMAEQGLITQEEFDEASEAELVLREGRVDAEEDAPYFVEAVRRQLEDALGTAIYTQGYTIHTTLDLDIQRAAEEELEQALRGIESGRYGGFPHSSYATVHADTTRDRREGTQYLQGALVVMEAQTGDILALIGGRDFDDSQFNRATQAKRQPGSAFKPFVYTAALSAGYPASHRLLDRPLRYVLDNNRVWEPRNYDGTFRGAVTMRQALTQSRNVPTVRLANEVGLSRVLGTAEQFGLGRMPSNPSVVLGTAEVTPLELTAAYGAFATLGSRPDPRFVTQVTDANGSVVWSQQPSARRVIDPGVAFIATTMMQDVVNRGTGTGVRGAGFSGAAAGKTGTTQDAADVWFVGYTPQLVGTVWIGFDKRQRILRGATGGEIAAPIWGRIMRRVDAGGGGWTAPAGVEERTVDEMGSVVSAGCMPQGATYTEYFLSGTSASGNCYPDAYAYGDTFGYLDEAWRFDSAGIDTSDGWWERLRQRVLGDDDGVRRAGEPDSLGVRGDTAALRRAGRDTTGQRADTARADTARPRPLGDPVRRDTTSRPPPDTTRSGGAATDPPLER
ncbi:MAG TPA: PBP1A family penicillin-binding protein [Longimicrobiales bacterium]|nr:PBP1A family penicillin-binding protein [Longimicrobiales bacterium]